MAPTTRRPQGDTALRAGAADRGGNTLFANAYAAYDALPQRRRTARRVIGAFA